MQLLNHWTMLMMLTWIAFRKKQTRQSKPARQSKESCPSSSCSCIISSSTHIFWGCKNSEQGTGWSHSCFLTVEGDGSVQLSLESLTGLAGFPGLWEERVYLMHIDTPEGLQKVRLPNQPALQQGIYISVHLVTQMSDYNALDHMLHNLAEIPFKDLAG